jgi:23S rRNA (guanosine2251-2'-O)-methyltransferase
MRQLRGKPLKDFMKRAPGSDLDLVFLLQNVQDPVNVGSAFRLADACGVTKMILGGVTAVPPHALITRVGRKKDRKVKWRHVEDTEAELQELGEAGYRRIAIEITAEAELYSCVDYGNRVCLVVGGEDHGVPHRILDACDGAVYLPMLGKGASLNVTDSLGVTAYHILQQNLTT